ncbi:MAG TPA: PaaI family thioesterase [Gemmatimonadaceae bacterium]|nr:PaaI family thioesterase [Gemmatimonadaceae bacterium]
MSTTAPRGRNEGEADPAIEERVRGSFARQRFMATLGARLTRVAPGEVEIELPYSDGVAQQHGFVHAGALATIADSACGYAALTMMPEDAAVMSVEFKINMLSPAEGPTLLARGRVLKAGRTLTVCRADVYSFASGDERKEKLVATMQGTMIAVRGRGLAD